MIKLISQLLFFRLRGLNLASGYRITFDLSLIHKKNIQYVMYMYMYSGKKDTGGVCLLPPELVQNIFSVYLLFEK